MVYNTSSRGDNVGLMRLMSESSAASETDEGTAGACCSEPQRRIWDRRHVIWTLVNCLIAIPLACIVSEIVEPPHHYFWYSVIFCAALLLPWISWEDRDD